MLITVDDLLKLVEPFRQKRRVRDRPLSISRLSKLLFDDGSRLKDMMEANSDISSRRLVAAFQWFSDNWPEEAVWPEGVPRPKRAAAVSIQTTQPASPQ